MDRYSSVASTTTYEAMTILRPVSVKTTPHRAPRTGNRLSRAATARWAFQNLRCAFYPSEEWERLSRASQALAPRAQTRRHP
jgi:hypothetical protein